MRNDKKSKSKQMALGAFIAAIYTMLVICLASITPSHVNFLIAESLSLLAWYIPDAILGLTVGSFLANFMSGHHILEIIISPFSTLIATLLVRKAKNLFLGSTYNIIVNTLIFSIVLKITLDIPIIFSALYVFIEESISCYVIGIPLMKALENRGILKRT